MNQFIKKIIKTNILWFISLLAMPVCCFAGNGVTPELIIQNIIDYLTGDLARVVGVIVVVGAGYMHLETQQISKKRLVQIITGMGLILGGATLADLFWG